MRRPDNDDLLRLCALACALNVLLVLSLAGLGVLKVAQPGDVTYTTVERTPHGNVTVAPGSGDRFAIERPTDVDAFYDAVVRVRAGGPLYNPWGAAWTIQRFHYAPAVYFLFLPFYFLGYVGFKLAWLGLSVGAVVLGTYLLLRAEVPAGDLSRDRALALSALSIGFAPMVTNFKVGQTTPIMYLVVSLSWWLFRRGEHGRAGAALAGATLVKPYFMSPLVLFVRRDRAVGIAGFLAAFVAANLLSVAAFGPGVTLQYYEVLVAFALETGTAFENDFSNWWSNSLRPFLPFGPLAPAVQALLVLPLAYLSTASLLGREDRPVELFSLSLLSVHFIVRATSLVDAAMLLAVLVVLGYRLYDRLPRAFPWLVASFLLLMGHPYFMELFVGWGAENVGAIAANEALVLAVVPLLQPGAYALALLLGLALYAWRELPAPG